MKTKIRETGWYNTAVAICIGVVLFVVLTHIKSILAGAGIFIGYFSTVITGCIIAYLVNLLARIFYNRVFAKLTKRRALISNICAYIVVLVAIVLMLLILIPQMVDSISLLVKNLDGYASNLLDIIRNLGLSDYIDYDSLIDKSKDILTQLNTYITSHLGSILSITISAGMSIAQVGIGFLLSMYILGEKPLIKAGFRRLLRALFGEKKTENIIVFLKDCDTILNNYVIYNLLDCIIVGCVNAVFMTILRMPYAGLISVIVAVTNLIPTFGPIFGAVIGALILLLIKPWLAVAFILFTIVLQLFDGYILKPRLFGDSLGVSGMWILIGILVGGSMFGIVGIIIAIPGVAILDLIYHKYLLPGLEGWQKKGKESECG